jgi:hypothetical protein
MLARTCRSVNIVATVLAVGAVAGSFASARAGSLTFDPDVHALIKAIPTSNGAGTLSALMGLPGTNGPTLNDINGANQGGFAFTDVTLTYTSAAADVDLPPLLKPPAMLVD